MAVQAPVPAPPHSGVPRVFWPREIFRDVTCKDCGPGQAGRTPDKCLPLGLRPQAGCLSVPTQAGDAGAAIGGGPARLGQGRPPADTPFLSGVLSSGSSSLGSDWTELVMPVLLIG